MPCGKELGWVVNSPVPGVLNRFLVISASDNTPLLLRPVLGDAVQPVAQKAGQQAAVPHGEPPG